VPLTSALARFFAVGSVYFPTGDFKVVELLSHVAEEVPLPRDMVSVAWFIFLRKTTNLKECVLGQLDYLRMRIASELFRPLLQLALHHFEAKDFYTVFFHKVNCSGLRFNSFAYNYKT